jgi:nitrogen regulatory protein P-II 2
MSTPSDSSLSTAKLITIVCEALAREPLSELLHNLDVSGFTWFEVQGEGHQGVRFAEMEEFANIQLEVILSPARADRLLEILQKEFFPKYAMIAYESDVRILRASKFLR